MKKNQSNDSPPVKSIKGENKTVFREQGREQGITIRIDEKASPAKQDYAIAGITSAANKCGAYVDMVLGARRRNGESRIYVAVDGTKETLGCLLGETEKLGVVGKGTAQNATNAIGLISDHSTDVFKQRGWKDNLLDKKTKNPQEFLNVQVTEDSVHVSKGSGIGGR